MVFTFSLPVALQRCALYLKLFSQTSSCSMQHFTYCKIFIAFPYTTIFHYQHHPTSPVHHGNFFCHFFSTEPVFSHLNHAVFIIYSYTVCVPKPIVNIKLLFAFAGCLFDSATSNMCFPHFIFSKVIFRTNLHIFSILYI